MVSEKLKKNTAKVARRWASTGPYEASEGRARSQWDRIIAPFLAGTEIDYSDVLELAVGHGRMTAILLERSERVVGVDVLQENLDFCSKRFAGAPNLKLVGNNGTDLAAVPDGSISFVFCFDSMVHFDSDVVRSYLGEFYRVLRHGGIGFCHHSNRDSNPAIDFERAAHARSFMSKALFEHYAAKEGLSVIKSRIIDWGAGAHIAPKLDCLTLFRR